MSQQAVKNLFDYLTCVDKIGRESKEEEPIQETEEEIQRRQGAIDILDHNLN